MIETKRSSEVEHAMFLNKQVKRVAFHDYWMEVPLFHYNNNVALRFDLTRIEHLNDKVNFAGSLFDEFSKNSDVILFCMLGVKIIEPKLKKDFFINKFYKEYCIEFYSRNEDLIYDYNNLTYLQVDRRTFSSRKFFEKIIKGKIGGLSFFIINLKEKTIFNLYDERGIDVCIRNKVKRKNLYNKFSNYVLDQDKMLIEKYLK